MTASFVIELLLFGVVGNASLAMAQSPGAFTAAGSMTTPRAGHTATLLANGTVLLAGGYRNVFPNDPLASAEIYDPATGQFSVTGNMTTPRVRHSAILLADGRVLITGGSSDISVEIYDPRTGTFAGSGTTLSEVYSWLETAALLPDGRVFIAGKPTAQLYDPVTGSFVATGPYALGAPEYVERVRVLADGRALLSGASNQLYDPRNNTFTPVLGMHHPEDVYTATLLMDGRVLFVGNEENDGFPADAEVFDPARVAFQAIDSASANHDYGEATLLPDGTVLITGGQLPGGNGEAVCEQYSPASGTFSGAANMIHARHEHTATLLTDGTVLIAGGFDVWPAPTSSTELYRPAAPVSAPLLFSLSGDGKGQGAIWHALTGQPASAALPAVSGEALSMYSTTLTDDGAIPPQVSVGGRAAEILYFGKAPGYPRFNQVNFRMPAGVAAGSTVPVRLNYLGRSTNEVTIAVR